MRKSNLTADDIWAAEKAADDRKRTRKTGLDMIPIRDQGATRLSNGVLFGWSVPMDKREPGVAYPHVPEGHFVLEIDGKRHLFNADEFAKWTRWV